MTVAAKVLRTHQFLNLARIDARFGHFPPNLLNSLDGGFAKLVASPLQFIDFKGLKKMTDPWVLSLMADCF
jgi:hypothetical protein